MLTKVGKGKKGEEDRKREGKRWGEMEVFSTYYN
jgi:hypothetical protein